MINRLRELQLRFQEQLEAMSARDRALAIILACGLAIVGVGGITWLLHGVLDDLASRVRLAKENLGEAENLSAEYQALSTKLQAAEARMGQFKPAQMNTYIETWANNAGVGTGIRKVDETGSETVGDFKERTYRVDLQRADLDGVVKFLYAIETSSYPIKVRNAQLSVVEVKDERLIDLGLELVAYSKEDEG
jgi:type II secretory pathway component PulM